MIVLHICTLLKIPSFHPTDNGVFFTNSYFTTSKPNRNIENTFAVFIVFLMSLCHHISTSRSVRNMQLGWRERKRRKDDMRDERPKKSSICWQYGFLDYLHEWNVFACNGKSSGSWNFYLCFIHVLSNTFLKAPHWIEHFRLIYSIKKFWWALRYSDWVNQTF